MRQPAPSLFFHRREMQARLERANLDCIQEIYPLALQVGRISEQDYQVNNLCFSY
jgi:hypothetical protein